MENSTPETNKNTQWTLILGVIIIILLFVAIGMQTYSLMNCCQTCECEPTSVPPTPTTQAPPTEPPPPTSASEVVIQSYSVDRDRINAGECANISWVVEGVDLVQLLQDGEMVMDQAPASHTYQACLPEPATYVYRLDVSNNAGSSNWMELQVIVDLPAGGDSPTQPANTGPVPTLPPATGPVTVQYFYVEPERITVGSCATISWEVTNADLVQLLRDEEIVVPVGQLVDSFTDCHNVAAIYKYRLEAKNSEDNYNVLELQVIVDP